MSDHRNIVTLRYVMSRHVIRKSADLPAVLTVTYGVLLSTFRSAHSRKWSGQVGHTYFNITPPTPLPFLCLPVRPFICLSPAYSILIRDARRRRKEQSVVKHSGVVGWEANRHFVAIIHSRYLPFPARTCTLDFPVHTKCPFHLVRYRFISFCAVSAQHSRVK